LNALGSGRVFEAVEGLTRIVRDDPTASAAYFYLSVIYTGTGQLEMARDLVERALDTDPDEGKFHYQLGIILNRSDDRVAARASLKQAIDLGMDGDEAAAWRELGDVHALLLERDAAFQAFQRAVELGPEDARNRLALGQFYLDRNEAGEALAHLGAAVELDPTLDGAHAALGVALGRSGYTDAAIRTFGRGIEINSADQKSLYSLAQTLMANGQDIEARDVMETYSQLETRISSANRAIDGGTQYFEDGDLTEARLLLDEAVVLAPNYSAAHQTLGEVILAAGEPEGAVTVLEQAVVLNPLSAGAYFSLGAAHHQTGQFEEALEVTRKAILLDDRDARYQRQLGEILIRLSREVEAQRAFENASRLELGQVD
jgi:tetratricopeptide (TPR) repeat protein